jgi:hypothetical protein
MKTKYRLCLAAALVGAIATPLAAQDADATLIEMGALGAAPQKPQADWREMYACT